MLDRLRLFIPFKDTEIFGLDLGDGDSGLVVLERYGVPLQGSISVDADGNRVVESTRHAWESLPTSYTPMAFKIHNNESHWPGVEIKASPAKLLQGHNVFGPTSIEDGGAEMLTLLSVTYPKLYDALNVPLTEVMELDATYSARLPNEHTCLAVLQFLKNVSRGHRKSRGDAFDTTIYWGSSKSRLVGLKAYLKSPEFHEQLKEKQKEADAGNQASARVVQVMTDVHLLEWVKNLIRWEATIKKRWLERRKLPTNLFKLAKYQREQLSDGKCVLEQWWHDVSKPIFAAFEGATMKIIDDDKMLSALKEKHVRISKNGKLSHEYAKNLFRTYRSLREYGWEITKDSMHKASFYRHVSEICECGVSTGQLQNLQGDHRRTNVVPVLRFVQVDFSAQRPAWYSAPVSQFNAACAA